LPAKALKTSSDMPAPDTALIVSWLATTGARLASISDGAHAQAVERSQDLEVALMVPARFAAEEHSHPPAGDDSPCIGRAERYRHPVGMLLGEAQSRLDQP